jgi:transposase
MSLDVKQVIEIAREQFKELLPELKIFPKPPESKNIKLPPELKRSWLESSIRL